MLFQVGWAALAAIFTFSIPGLLISKNSIAKAGITNWSKNLIQLYSFSKSCCIPGHRLGAITTDKGLISQISKIMDNIQICAPRPAQHSVAKFLPHLENFVNEKMRWKLSVELNV